MRSDANSGAGSMKRFWPFVLAPVLAATLFAASPLQNPAESAGGAGLRFPRLAATNLERRSMNLPQDFGGSRNLLLIAFQRHQQKEVDTWLAQTKQFESLDPALRCYELPTLGRLNQLTRWFIDNGMRGGISSFQQREHTITLYVEKGPFRLALGIPDENRIYALLIDRDGNILWRAEGSFDEVKSSSLKKALQRFSHVP
jgi:hypothetical protein